MLENKNKLQQQQQQQQQQHTKSNYKRNDQIKPKKHTNHRKIVKSKKEENYFSSLGKIIKIKNYF